MLCSCTNKEEIIIQQEHVNVEQEEIIIEIKGAVKIPGLYTSYKGVLLFEIINQAGGYRQGNRAKHKDRAVFRYRY